MEPEELKEYLDFKADQYENPNFIESDPIQLVHQFNNREDMEIIGFLVSTIAWGNRKMIIRSGEKLIDIMGSSPHDFIMNYKEKTQPAFVHRTFNSNDLDFYFRALHAIYQNGTLEKAFAVHPEIEGIKGRIVNFRNEFIRTDHLPRSEKHLSNPIKNSASKRLNMFLRWMVRSPKKGVDLGIWKEIDPSELYIPLDVHTSTTARKLGLLTRKQDNWKALEEIMDTLKRFNPDDPAKYDFALFGVGAFEEDL